jgi:ATP-dependent Clp protease adaptor protein ClpS
MRFPAIDTSATYQPLKGSASAPWYGPAVTPQTLIRPRRRHTGGLGTGSDKPWHVIVLNDDHNTFQGVAFALSSVLPGVSFDQGLALANRIHNSGRAIVWSGQREQAELYWEQLRSHGLTMSPLEQ